MYKEFVRPVLDRMDSETWHVRTRELLHGFEATPLTLKLLELLGSYHHKRHYDARLNVILGGVSFDNPIVVGAGWDKNGSAVKALHTLGFAGVEVGSVLANPQPGNEKPRQFMITPGVSLNRLGFNSPGMEVVAQNLERYRNSRIPIGISLGINKEVNPKDAPAAHARVAKRLYDFASYFVINVSSPNTPGLRALQDKGPLTEIVKAVKEVVMGRKPVFVKIAPDLTDTAINDVIQVVEDNNLNGIVASNTTNNPDIKGRYGKKWQNQAGGLSGDDPSYRRMTTEKIRHIYKETKGKMNIIGVGGINSADAALEKIGAGAKVLQIVTGIRGEGPGIAGKINRGIIKFMDKNGVKNINELVGQV